MNNTKKRIAATLSAALITSAALPVVAAATQYTDYTVKSGDNLYRLAIQFNTTVDEIVAANNIANRHMISVNQYLSIPTNTKDSSSSGSTTTTTPNTGSSAGTQYYYVLKNDTLSDIAKKFGVTVSELASWNNISNIDFIREGALLKIGTSSGSVGSTGSSSSSGSSSNTGSSSSSSGQYLVKKNDTLSEIAVKYGTTVAQLAAWNNISNIHLIYEGTTLKVSGSSSSTGSNSGTVASYEHKVVAGDNLYRLAITYGTTVSQLAAWNNISNVRLIHVGDVLQVAPATSTRTSETMSTTVESPIVSEVETAVDNAPTVDVATSVEATAPVGPTVDVTISGSHVVTVTVDDDGEHVVADSVGENTLEDVIEHTAIEIPETASVEVAETASVELAETVPTEVAETAPVEVAETAPVEVAESVSSEMVETPPSAPVSELELTTETQETLSSTVKTYIVPEATTIFHLAALFNTPASSLITWNDLEDNQLTAGTEVIIAQ